MTAWCQGSPCTAIGLDSFRPSAGRKGQTPPGLSQRVGKLKLYAVKSIT